MPELIAIKIDTKAILKEHLFTAQSGKVYLDALLIPSKDSKYGDSHFIVQSLPKELREGGQRGPIIGNAKIMKQKPKDGDQSQRARESAAANAKAAADDDMPF